MSLSDTAEYWNDVKSSFGRFKPIYTHAKNCQCGHYHVAETKMYREVDCNACKKVIAEMGNIFELNMKTKKEADELVRLDRIKRKCECGGHFHDRVNKSSGEKFFGCNRYPKCKKTKSKL